MKCDEPQQEHAFLQRLVGDWEMVSTRGYDGYDPNDPEQRFTETIKSVNGLWIVSEGRGKMPDGSPMTAIITLGFDPAKGNYVGTWIGSMMSHLWIYKGWMEPDGKTLVLEAEGPRMGGEGTAVYHDILILHDDNSRSFSGSIQQPDGSFKEFMSSEFRRKAA